MAPLLTSSLRELLRCQLRTLQLNRAVRSLRSRRAPWCHRTIPACHPNGTRDWNVNRVRAVCAASVANGAYVGPPARLALRATKVVLSEVACPRSTPMAYLRRPAESLGLLEGVVGLRREGLEETYPAPLTASRSREHVASRPPESLFPCRASAEGSSTRRTFACSSGQPR